MLDPPYLKSQVFQLPEGHNDLQKQASGMRLAHSCTYQTSTLACSLRWEEGT